MPTGLGPTGGSVRTITPQQTPQEQWAARGGQVGDWSEALALVAGAPDPRLCAVLYVRPDGTAVVMPNPDPVRCGDPDHIYREASALIDQFRDVGPNPPWERLEDGGYLSALADPDIL